MVTISATYASDLSRVRIAVSGVHADANYALIERSTDQIKWTTVRGGSAVTLSAGACSLDDYEFIPNVLNYYRATYVDSSDPSSVAEGTLSTANNANVTPGIPAGVQDGDVLLMFAAIRNTAGVVTQPTNWVTIADGGNFKIFARVYAAGVGAPTVSFTGGVANADTAARISSYRNAAYDILGAVQSNASAQDVLFPAVAAAAILPNILLVAAWKQATSTGATVSDMSLVSRNTATAGDDMTVAWFVKLMTENHAAGTVVMTGGSAAVSKAAVVRLTRKPFIAQETGSTTPTLTQLWLKNIQKPYLNRPVVAVGQSEVDAPSRSGLFDIVGRSKAVAVTELRGGDEYVLTIKTETQAERDDMKYVLAGGDVVFLQGPPDCPFQTGYFLIGRTSTKRGQSTFSARRFVDLPLVECAAPNPVLVGTTATWQGVVNAYATWADVIAAEATWADLIDHINDPSDVVVP